MTWELAGKYPNILKDEVVGEAATKLFADAQQLLDEIIQNKLLKANAVIGFWKGRKEGEDFLLETGDRFLFLRQQTQKAKGQPNLSLIDFLKDEDHIGSFVVSCGEGLEKLVEKFKKDHDDYKAIMAQALADRLAEALAEMMHEKVRKELWGYAKAEDMSNEDLIAEKYQGIRPAPGYPACPDHLEKRTIFKLLEAESNIGVSLTDSLAMYPAASVSGYYFAHPESKYFGLGKIDKSQLEDYAKRRGICIEEAEYWLSPILNY